MNISKKEIKWDLYVGSPIVSSPLIYNGILVAATYDSWIKDTSFTGKNFLLGIDSNYGTQIWNYEIPGGVFSSPCLVGSDGMTVVVGSMDKFIYAIERVETFYGHSKPVETYGLLHHIMGMRFS